MRDIVASSGWPPSHLHIDRLQSQRVGKASLSCCRECKGDFGSKWLRGGCCWRCRSALRDSGRCPSSNSSQCMVCPHLRACFACDGISCSACGVLRSVAVESDGSLFDWLFQLHPQPQTLYLDFDATLCNTASGGAPQVGKHALHGELAAIVESGAFQIVIVTKQNPQHHAQIVAFLEALGWKEGREYLLRCIGGTGVSKSSIIQTINDSLQQSNAQACSVFIDDSIKEILHARSELPLSVTMLVFAAAKSSYVRSHFLGQGLSTSNSLAVAAVHPEEVRNDAAVTLLNVSQAAAHLEHVLETKKDMSASAFPSGVHSTTNRTTLSLSSSASVASVSVKDGPGWTVATETSPVLHTVASTESGAGN